MNSPSLVFSHEATLKRLCTQAGDPINFVQPLDGS